MSLRYALLALLTAEPLTGYDAAKRFGASVGHVWHAADSQIYPELRRMEADELVDSRAVRWGPNSTKNVYSITDAGIGALRTWLDEPLDYIQERDAPHMRAAYFEWAQPDAARRHLLRHIEFHQTLLDQWQAQRTAIVELTHPTIAKRLDRFPDADHDRIVAYKAFAYDGLIARARVEIDWAHSGLALIDRLEGPDQIG